jgi:hypothetical protein
MLKKVENVFRRLQTGDQKIKVANCPLTKSMLLGGWM